MNEDGSRTKSLARNDFVPALRLDLLIRTIGDETIVWSPIAPKPSVLDPVAAVMVSVVDGVASVAELAQDVHEVVGLDLESARRQVARVLTKYDRAKMLTSSRNDTSAVATIAARELFAQPCTECTKSAARSMAVLALKFATQTIGVACYPPRALRKLRKVLIDYVVEHDDLDDDALAFAFTGPVGLDRTHRLTDRSGLVQSSGPGLGPGLGSLLEHLTAFLPIASGSARFRASLWTMEDIAVLVGHPLGLVPTLVEPLLGTGARRIDRLAVDICATTGNVTNPQAPTNWLPIMSTRRVTPGSAFGQIQELVWPRGPELTEPTRGQIVVDLAGESVGASAPREVLDAAINVVSAASVRTARLGTVTKG